MVAMEADMCSVGDVAPKPGQNAACWDSIIAECSDVLKHPRMPADHDTVHQIELEPGSVPLYKW